MNIYFWIIISTLVISFLLDFIADYMNQKYSTKPLPAELKDVYDESSFTKSQKYLNENTRFGFIGDIFDFVLLLFVWFGGYFNELDLYVRNVTDNPIYAGMLFIIIISGVKFILDLPFSIYSTFVIEEKYGFNKTTLKTYILDIIKSMGLSAVLGLPILWLVLYFFQELGTGTWIYLWLIITAISFAIQYIAPTWIMPIFNKFTPLEEGSLKEKINELATKANFPLVGVFVIDGSKRSTKSNAFFTGFGKNKRIALYDTLINNHTEDELTAILAHEIGHYKKKHILTTTILSTIQSFFIFWLFSIFVESKELHTAFFMDNVSIYTGLIFFGMLLSPLNMILSIGFSILSRKNEYEADNFAKTLTGTADGLISALKKLSKDNLSNINPHPFYVFINYSHPTLLQRIKALIGE